MLLETQVEYAQTSDSTRLEADPLLPFCAIGVYLADCKRALNWGCQCISHNAQHNAQKYMYFVYLCTITAFLVVHLFCGGGHYVSLTPFCK